MAELTLDSVTKLFNEGGNDEVVAVDDLTMGIEDGEFLVLVGPSGCGKSTTLRMIAGLETVTDGEIRLGTRTINDSSPADRDIAMVFQSYALYPT
ncbi:trehalose/maltose import ATP-binding protein MalK [Halolamina pelagica]|uniref:Trehalose/maltose import ATP-binding protein MalK n=1 Tax=Halolamina pelagica TaxID=699431 RepID=A0A0P7HV63_9EURY|nr:trehalose/maltose import ATP-binding protein MalK [Halolamina pelagica]